ncbi:group II intron maturase-specific domain-containing protein [Streptomyces sp. NPDC046942]|uniref:group II intron maturase-specific domain-containing protein n=1 Tax=Streptomyces sp. NPDC046942 TaxID=3155137 RepID=UPI0033EE0786
MSFATFSYLRNYLWHMVWRWVQRKHPKTGWRKIFRRYCGRRSWWTSETRELFNPITVGTTRYPLAGPSDSHSLGRHGMRATTTKPSGLVESRVRCQVVCPVREAAPGRRTSRKTGTAPRADFTKRAGRLGGLPHRASSLRRSTCVRASHVPLASHYRASEIGRASGVRNGVEKFCVRFVLFRLGRRGRPSGAVYGRAIAHSAPFDRQ